MSAPDLPADLIRYVELRDRQRAAAVVRTLNGMSVRELQLVCEAAVMGYVIGSRFGAEEKIPPDSDIVGEVVGACLSMSDVYPIMASLTNDGQE